MSRVSPEHGDASVSLLNLEQRDPKKIHDTANFKVAWPDIFAEPDPGVHSFKGVWKASFVVFNFTRLWTYRILSICGVLSACCFGCNYGCSACYTIWCCQPMLSMMRLCCMPLKIMYTICLDVCCAPVIRVYSFLLWNIRVTMVKGGSNAETV